MMRQTLTAQIREKIYYSLISCSEQKGCGKRICGAEDLLYIDQHILNEGKTRRKNLAMAWIDYKKSYDIVHQSWILHCPKIYKISDPVVQLVYREDHGNLGNGIDSRKRLNRGKDPKRHIPGNALSPLLFVIAMMPLNHILWKFTAGYKLSIAQEKNQPLDVHGRDQTFCQKRKKLETLIQTVRICRQDIGKIFCIEKCAMLVRKSGKRHMTDGVVF